jgi:hypothetical protein
LISEKQYEKIIKEGNRVDWYGDLVPEELITHQVRQMATMITENIDVMESDSELKGKLKTKRADYIKKLWQNVRNLPYRLNGDFTLKKKKRIESEVEVVEKKKKVKKTRKKTTKPKTKTSRSRTKNSELIFGKTKK